MLLVYSDVLYVNFNSISKYRPFCGCWHNYILQVENLSLKIALDTMGKNVWSFLKKLKIDLLCDPVTPLLGLYPKMVKLGTPRTMCMLIFAGALSTTTKR